MKIVFLLLPIFLLASCNESDLDKTTINTSETIATPVQETSELTGEAKAVIPGVVTDAETVLSDSQLAEPVATTETVESASIEIKPIPVTEAVATSTIATEETEIEQTDPSQIYDIKKDYKRIETSSPEEADKSIAVIRYALSAENRTAFDESMRKIAFSMITPENLEQEEGGKKPEVKMLEGMFKAVNGKTAEEIIQYASSI